MELKEQDVISGVKWYFDPVDVTNNLWRINLLIMIILEDKNISLVRGVQLQDFTGMICYLMNVDYLGLKGFPCYLIWN